MAEAPKSETEKSIASMDRTRFADGATPVAELRLKLQKEMQDHAAVYRTQEVLEEGVVRTGMGACVSPVGEVFHVSPVGKVLDVSPVGIVLDVSPGVAQSEANDEKEGMFSMYLRG